MVIPDGHRDKIAEGDTPSWVVINETGSPPETPPDGASYPDILRDDQRNLETDAYYYRNVYYLPNMVSVQYGSRIQIQFSPDREQLIIHTLAVHRNGQVIDLRPVQEIRVLDREAQMERFVFDGCLLAVFLLADVHAGDTVEYAYSLQGIKPPQFGRLSGRFIVRSNFAAKAVRCRLVYHPDRAIYSQSPKTEWVPQTAYTHEGLVECQWLIPDVKPLAHLPGFNAPIQAIDYSEFATWEEVAEAASKLFSDATEPLPSHLANWVEQIRQSTTSAEELILQIVRYVQENIRYVAVAIDEHTHKPYDILTILERHYGDCKDKSILLCRLLRGAGYDALPALVNAQRRGHAIKSVARPGAFDHAIVRLRLEDKVHWIDATLTHQGGKLETMWHPGFGFALVLCSPGTALETVSPPPTIHSHHCGEFIKVLGHGGTAELRVTNTYAGYAADEIRRRLAAQGSVAIEQDLLTAYNELYSKVTLHAPHSVTDDREANKITMIHHFMLANIWRTVQSSQRLNQAYFPVFGFRRVLIVPKQGHRSQSFRIEHPIWLGASLEVRVPAGLEPKRFSKKIDSPGFECTCQMQASSTVGRIDLKYQSLKSILDPAELDRHEKSVQLLAQLAGIRMTMSEIFVQRGSAPPSGRQGRP